jgi:photosystem II stability/assembly factor-like uncharacterized protein
MDNNAFSTHRGHSDWFGQRSVSPLRDADPRTLEQFWRDRAARAESSDLNWEFAGPNNFAGRMTALLVHPVDEDPGHDVLIAGSAAGGVWRSQDGGKHWETTWPRWASPYIGALAVDPNNPQTVYCATGEANLSPDCYPGSGICVSYDGGGTWSSLAPADGDCALPRRIGALHVNPADSRVLYLGGIAMDETSPSGLFYSGDAGKSWDRVNFFSEHRYWCYSIALHPAGLLFAAIDSGGAQNGIYRWTPKPSAPLPGAGPVTPALPKGVLDPGAGTWQALNVGLTGDQFGRTSLAIAPSRPDTIYALVASRHGKKVVGIYRSIDRGDSWTRIDGADFAAELQASYNNTMAVHPHDPNFLVCGLVDVHITANGGAEWTRASQWDAHPESSHNYVHEDQHAVVLPGGDSIYTANDGGIDVSRDRGKTWARISDGLGTAMFYSLSVAVADSRVFGGGTQDNGCLVTVGNPAGQFVKAQGGDGASAAFHPTETTHVYLSRSDLKIFRHTDRRLDLAHWDDPSWEDVTPPPADLTDVEHKQNSMSVVVIDPVRPQTVWFGTNRLWRTQDDGATWVAVTPPFDGSAIACIHIAPASPDRMLAGTAAGGVFRSFDRGATWSSDVSGPQIPSRLISSIASNPQNAGDVVLTIAGAGLMSRLIPKSMRHKMAVSSEGVDRIWHVFLSHDFGTTWQHADSPEMPDVAHHAVAYETNAPHRVFVANDCGVWASGPGFDNWSDISGNLPNVMLTALVYHQKDRVLLAATHGRGIWRLRF